MSDDLRFWFAGFDSPRRYSNWVADACYAWYLVEFDKALAVSFLERLKANYAAWEREHFDVARGLFKWIPDRDGMEASVAGFEQGAGDGFRWNTVIFGGEGYRPSLNSYMAADAAAIARIAELAGDRATAETFARKADALRRKIQSDLWNGEKQFFIAAPGRRLPIRRRPGGDRLLSLGLRSGRQHRPIRRGLEATRRPARL